MTRITPSPPRKLCLGKTGAARAAAVVQFLPTGCEILMGPENIFITMTSLSNAVLISKSSGSRFSSGSSLKSVDEYLGATNLAFGFKRTGVPPAHTRTFIVRAAYSDGGRQSNGSVFISGFVLGGLIVGTLGCVYAPQISKALTGTDKKDLMKKLPKFIYDEEKALEKQRKKLAEKIEQLNLAIDTVSNQLRSEEPQNGAAVNSDDIEAVI